ncbi:MAG: glycosyltransferase, partial [Armatimonadetes bacterium]|nr:glycosyltransferase [Armatimonadota bacterium]
GKGPEEAALRDAAGTRVEITTEPFAQQGALAAADLAVVPSVTAGFSFSAVEAMYQGVPALMRRTGGLPEIAADHETGFYFETDEEMLDVLGHLCHKPEVVQAVGKAARERVLAQFDLARAAREYAEVYKKVAKA